MHLAGAGVWRMKTSDHVEALLSSSNLVVYGRFSADGVVLHANERLNGLIGERVGPVNLADLLAPDDRERVPEWLRDGQQAIWPEFLHFVDAGGASRGCRVHATWDGDELLLLAEPALGDLEAARTRLNSELRRTLEELRAARKHLRRSANRAPICWSCGKVRVGEDSWQTVESYLEENRDSTVREVCPECAEHIRTLHMGRPQSAGGRAGVAAVVRENHDQILSEVCGDSSLHQVEVDIAQQRTFVESDFCTQAVEIWLEAVENDLDRGCAAVAIEETLGLLDGFRESEESTVGERSVRVCMEALSRRIEVRLTTDEQKAEYLAYRLYVEKLVRELTI
jgi:hypothetical protein